MSFTLHKLFPKRFHDCLAFQKLCRQKFPKLFHRTKQFGVYRGQVRSQPVFSGKPEGPFCLSCTFIFRNERIWMKKSARVSEKLVSPGLPGLQVATRLVGKDCSNHNNNDGMSIAIVDCTE